MLKFDEKAKIKIFAFETQILRFKCENLDFCFFVKLQHSLAPRVLEIWQWSNNQKASILLGEFKSEIIFGARALPRAPRAIRGNWANYPPPSNYPPSSFWKIRKLRNTKISEEIKTTIKWYRYNLHNYCIKIILRNKYALMKLYMKGKVSKIFCIF